MPNTSSTASYTSFDAMGRVLASNQTTAGLTYNFSYSYNPAGSLTSETYPSGRVVQTAYDGTGRPSTLSGTLNSQTTNYITQTAYWPRGAPYYFTPEASLPMFNE